MNMRYIHLKLISALLAIALLLACVPALAVGSFEAVVSVDSMRVYAQKSPHKLLGKLPRGTVVTVTAWSGKAALITVNGKSGVARVSDMTRAGQADQTADETAQGQSITTNRDTRVYRRPSTRSPYAAVKAGTVLQLLAVRGNCAKVELNGKVGYAVYSHLGDHAVATPAATETPSLADEAAVQTGSLPVVTTEETQVYANADYTGEAITVAKGASLTMLALRGDCAMVERNGAIGYVKAALLQKDTATKAEKAVSKANPFATGSTEYTIFAFLTGDMRLNRAAAMGVMANMYFESGYKTVINGDGGTSYGLCQWHAGRKTNLINYCNEHGLDYNTAEGQLKFLQYELTNRYTSVDKYIRQVENTADGAYDAAYYFCFNFEAPAARTSQSTKRGNYAKNTLWEMK